MKILHFIHGLGIGGAESFLFNLIKSIGDNPNFNFDFVIQDKNIVHEYFANLNKNHPERFKIIPTFPSKLFGHFYFLWKIIKNNDYDALHIHMNSFVNPIPVIVCKFLNIPAIVHSHNIQNASGGIFAKCIHKLNVILFNHGILRVACSPDAGKWMFNKRDFEVVNNAIDIDKFIYKSSSRDFVRTDLGITKNAVVIGMVGRLHVQKNHKRGIEIFKDYLEINPNSILIIIGNGELRAELESFAKSLDIHNSVLFLGAIKDPSKYYSAMDLFLFPSFYEGLSIASIEAQASGLPILASSTIPESMDISGNVKFLNLNLSNNIWVDGINNLLADSSEKSRVKIGMRMKSSSFSLSNLLLQMSKIYKRANKSKSKS